MAWTVPIWIAAFFFGIGISAAEPLKNEVGIAVKTCDAGVTDRLNGGPHRATRTIEDPTTGERWAVKQNSIHPEWPSRLVPIPEEITGMCLSLARNGAGSGRRSATSTLPVVVHSGDVLAAVEDTAAWHAELQGTALTSGTVGESILVRLRVGNRIVRVRIAAAGRALLEDKERGGYR